MQPFVVETWPNPPEESRMRFVSTFVAFCFYVIAAQAELAGSRPNLVLIIADDMAWDDCSLYGNKGLPTPNIDRMAAEGVEPDRFTMEAVKKRRSIRSYAKKVLVM